MFFSKNCHFWKPAYTDDPKKTQKMDFWSNRKILVPEKNSGTRESENPGTREFLVKISFSFLVIKNFSFSFLNKIDRKKNFIFIFLPVFRNPYRDFVSTTFRLETIKIPIGIPVQELSDSLYQESRIFGWGEPINLLHGSPLRGGPASGPKACPATEGCL